MMKKNVEEVEKERKEAAKLEAKRALTKKVFAECLKQLTPYKPGIDILFFKS